LFFPNEQRNMFVIAVGVSFLALASANSNASRMQFIDEINSVEGILWEAAVSPKFAGLPIGVSKSLCGVKPESKEALAAAVASGEVQVVSYDHGSLLSSGYEALPTDFDSATNWPQCAKVIQDIRDQSNCGCCWAFAAASAASDRLCVATNGTVALPLSAQETCFCASGDGCDGGFVTEGWNYLKKNGLVTGGQYLEDSASPSSDPFSGAGFCSAFSLPHCHHHGPVGSDPYPSEGAPGCPSVKKSPKCPTKCDSSAKAPHNEFASDSFSFSGSTATFDSAKAIQQAILTGGPVEAAFTVYSDFENYASGIYHHVSGSVAGGHAIRIVGWGVEDGTDYWKIANSWNPHWGENGYFRIKRGSNECGIEEQVAAAASNAKWSGPGVKPGPGPTPAPTPTPAPKPTPTPTPTPGKSCFNIDKKGSCKDSPRDCKWCQYSGYGICIVGDISCP